MREVSWCRGVEGQEHEVEFWRDQLGPNCQPLRDFVRDQLLNPLPRWKTTSKRTLARWAAEDAENESMLAEDWECFHRPRCRRCRRNLVLILPRIRAVECPVKRGLEPAGPPDPPQDVVERHHREL